jgi:glycosyltransferase involved in cell wall biosynthesis
LTRVVIVSGFRIFPVGLGAQVRTSGIARALARSGYDVLIYSLAGRREDYRFPPTRFWRCDRLESRLTEETNLGLGFGLTQAVLRRLGYPRIWQHWLMSHALIPRRLRAALQCADVILSDMVFCAPVPGPWAHKPWFLISHQIEHHLLQHVGQGGRRFVDRVQEIEEQAPLHFRDIFAVAEDDRDFFRAHDPCGRLRVPIVRCGVDVNAYSPIAEDRQRVRRDLGLEDNDWLIVFSASRFGPNLAALEQLKQFARREAAFLARERVYFLVLGSIEPQASREGALISTGWVPEVQAYLAASDAGLNPVTRGAGSNVKMFEYVAARLPVVSTAFGARGTELQAGRDFIHFEPEGLRGAISQLVTAGDRAYWRAFADAVLARHRRSIDIAEAVADAIRCVQDFPPP